MGINSTRFPKRLVSFFKTGSTKGIRNSIFSGDFFEKTIIFLNRKTTVSDTVFPHIVSAETILFWIWKSKGHST